MGFRWHTILLMSELKMRNWSAIFGEWSGTTQVVATDWRRTEVRAYYGMGIYFS